MIKHILIIIFSLCISAYLLSIALGGGITDGQKSAIIMCAFMPLLSVFMGIKGIIKEKKSKTIEH